MKTIQEISSIVNQVVDLLAAEKCNLREAEEILKHAILKIRATSLVQDSTHVGGLNMRKYEKKTQENENPFGNLPFSLDISLY